MRIVAAKRGRGNPAGRTLETRARLCHDRHVRIDPRLLHERRFDLVVVGAGIHGAAVARDAALRGRSVLLLDARDLAAGTSSRSSRLVHGGLRYLRHGHFGLVREALHERERLLRTAPHLVRPLPMLMPFFRDVDGLPGSGASRLAMRLGTWLYQGLAGRSTLPGPRSLSADDALAAFPGLRRRGLRSALEFFDAATVDVRLVLANVLDAVAHGAVLATHTELVGVVDGGVLLQDRLGDSAPVVRTDHVVNAAGPRVDALRLRLGIDAPALTRQSRGSHLVLAPRAGELALAAFLPDRRIQFVIPHDGGTLCGTTDVDDPLPGDETGPPEADVDYLLGAMAHLFEVPPSRADVRFCYAGWRALPTGQGPPGALHREAFLVREAISGAALHTIVGGKLTTHRSFAERVTAAVTGDLTPSPTRTRPLPGGDGPREVADPLWWRHGSRVQRVRDLCRERPEWRAPLCPHRPFLAAELVLALRDEGAATFADALLRRLVHTAGPCREPACLRAAHTLFLQERRWPVDDDPDLAIAALHDELQQLCGALELGQPGPSAVETS